MLVNTRRLAIEWGDCDPAGIVFYPRYFAMFDASTAALFQRALGMTKKAMLRHWGAFGEKKLYGKVVEGVIRSTFVLDEDGVVTHAWYNVKASGHVAKVMRDLGLAAA